MAKTFWGNVFEFGATVVAVTTAPVAILAGAADAITGKETLEEQYKRLGERIQEYGKGAGKYGDEHHQQIQDGVQATAAVVTTVASVIMLGRDNTQNNNPKKLG